MRLCVLLKSRMILAEESLMQKIKEDIEFALSDIDGVIWAVFDTMDMKIDVEYDEEDDDFDITDLVKTVQE